MHINSIECFSKEIRTFAQAHERSRLARFLLWIEYCRRRWHNTPMSFPIVEGVGEPVGEPIEVYHLSLHDMMAHEACGRLTAEVLLRGRRINAFSRESYQQVEEMVGKTIIQPRWV